ncbi:DNA-deoxyinosine glycosylase [Rheinheimera sp. D18]|uniref:DNA-deoxyinosine glycosylase n=1 Tax=Rheinheimera sp. D18 TaxID=2545632 RepID=UPI001051ADE2|nr:DNA-deoxyinosine glycosylase [Rheinheimera sp. D18]QBL08060.1 DNA-deoxyinosine glycosylase [Rheinheimera sp. D18]
MADNELTGLAPNCLPTAKVLVLGSMPGVASLKQQQYYGHPRNAFWPIMASLLQFPLSLSYPERLARLQQQGVALWDVIGRCQRQGSLDSAIRAEQANDFTSLFARLPQLRAIAFNGAKAGQSFQRRVLPVAALPLGVSLLYLPSTSPAHASLSFQQKLIEWQKLSAFLSS